MDQNTTWYGGRPRLRRHGVRWEPSHFALVWSPAAELLFQLVFRVTNDDVQLGRLKTQVRKTQYRGMEYASIYGKRNYECAGVENASTENASTNMQGWKTQVRKREEQDYL